VVNLGAEGLMLCAAIAGFAAVVHTGNDWLGFAAGMGAGAVLAAIFGVLVIWLTTNQYATGLALSLFGAGLSAFIGQAYTGKKLQARSQRANREGEQAGGSNAVLKGEVGVEWKRRQVDAVHAEVRCGVHEGGKCKA
jgi:ABC-type uncharacterized transport system permease subunit